MFLHLDQRRAFFIIVVMAAATAAVAQFAQGSDTEAIFQAVLADTRARNALQRSPLEERSARRLWQLLNSQHPGWLEDLTQRIFEEPWQYRPPPEGTPPFRIDYADDNDADEVEREGDDGAEEEDDDDGDQTDLSLDEEQRQRASSEEAAATEAKQSSDGDAALPEWRQVQLRRPQSHQHRHHHHYQTAHAGRRRGHRGGTGRQKSKSSRK